MGLVYRLHLRTRVAPGPHPEPSRVNARLRHLDPPDTGYLSALHVLLPHPPQPPHHCYRVFLLTTDMTWPNRNWQGNIKSNLLV